MRISTLDLLNFCCVLLTLCCSGISVFPLFPRQLLSQLLGLGLLIRFDAYLGNIYACMYVYTSVQMTSCHPLMNGYYRHRAVWKFVLFLCVPHHWLPLGIMLGRGEAHKNDWYQYRGQWWLTRDMWCPVIRSYLAPPDQPVFYGHCFLLPRASCNWGRTIKIIKFPGTCDLMTFDHEFHACST